MINVPLTPAIPLSPPVPADRILLHACCAPCSAAIVEALLANGVRPALYYCNPNIWPVAEYERRRDECRRHADLLGVEFLEAGYDHARWLDAVAGMEREPERGARCLACFRMRLSQAAEMASEGGFPLFATTLSTSRWKDLSQISQAGELAAAAQGVPFWGANWRKGGLSERRRELLAQYGFYNQQYCGCEFSVR